MGSERVRFSVVICAYTGKRWEELVAAVESLRVQTYAAHEVILVIDHNPELAQRVWREIPDVTCVENHGRQGLSDARNSGLAVARGDIVAFLDDGSADPAVVGVGGFAQPEWAEGRPGWFPREFDWVVGCTYRGMPETASPVRNLIGCNMSFRREIFDDLGGLAAGSGRLGTRPVGCEETELCIRIAQRRPGSFILFDPRAVVHHHVPGSRGTRGYF